MELTKTIKLETEDKDISINLNDDKIYIYSDDDFTLEEAVILAEEIIQLTKTTIKKN